MNILDCPEELILYIFVPSNISKIFDSTNWLFTCKKLYGLQNKLIDKGYVKNDKAVSKIIDIILKLRFNNIDYISLKTYTKLIEVYPQPRNVYFSDNLLSDYVNSLIRSLAKYIFNRLNNYKKDQNQIMIKNMSNILLWIISYNEMLEIKINQNISQSKINMLKSRIVDNIIESENITYTKSHFDIVHKDYFSYDVQEKIEIMCIKNGKFIISVTNMFNSIVGNNSRIRIKDIKTKEYNEFVEDDSNTDDDGDDYYDDDYYSVIDDDDQVTRFFIEKYTKEYQKINHFY
jgi:hypothetical protein